MSRIIHGRSFAVSALSIALSVLVALASPAGAGPTSRWSESPFEELAKRVSRSGDQATPEDIRALADYRTPEAASVLIEAYDSMASVAARRNVVRALASFHGTEAESAALTRLGEIARKSADLRVRDAAVESLSASASGLPQLAALVDSGLDDELRVLALERHVLLGGAEHFEWYEKLFEHGADRGDGRSKTKAKKRKRKGADEEPKAIVHIVPELRALAFEKISPALSKSRVHEATEDPHLVVRAVALRVLVDLDPRAAARRAKDIVEASVERDSLRALAARILVQVRGPRAGADLIDLARKSSTPEELRATIAELIAGSANEAAVKKLSKLLGKSRAARHERLFALEALPPTNDDKVFARIIAELEGDDAVVRLAAAEALGERDVQLGRDALRATLQNTAEPLELRAIALKALGELNRGASAEERERFQEELSQLAGTPELELRNAALQRLIPTEARLEVFRAALAHEDWSTRYQALLVLEDNPIAAAVPMLIERLGQESGRLREALADALFQMTAQPFGQAAPNWQHWWDNFAEDFELASAEDLEEAQRRKEERSAAMVTRAEFFGIQVVSHRVVFVLDTSGSMGATLRPRFEGDIAGATRLESAIAQIESSIEALHPDAHLNVIAFSGGVNPWRQDGIGLATVSDRADLLEWVHRLGPGGGTNLYDALRAAFSDLEADTIFVLSDGAPDGGEVDDPFLIRQHVQRWNASRGVVIQTVSIGPSLDILRWLAEDSGGEYRWIR